MLRQQILCARSCLGLSLHSPLSKKEPQKLEREPEYFLFHFNISIPNRSLFNTLGNLMADDVPSDAGPEVGTEGGESGGGSVPEVDDEISSKLTGMLGSFEAFNLELKDETRKRRDVDLAKITKIKRDFQGLETQLQSESKHRKEMNRSLQAWCLHQVADVKEELVAALEVRVVNSQEQFDSLSVYLSGVEKVFEADKVRIKEDIEQRNAALQQQLADFQKMFQKEVDDRFQREARIKKTLAEHEAEVSQMFGVEKDARELKYKQLRTLFEQNAQSRTRADENFRQAMKAELSDLNNELLEEQRLRESQDKTLSDGLQKFTNKLQKSLHVINVQVGEEGT